MTQGHQVRHSRGRQINQSSSMINPATIYLNSLAPSGRRAVNSLLNTSIKLLGYDDSIKSMPWHELRYQHLSMVRSVMIEMGKSMNTINLTLASLRGVSSTSFRLGQVNADEALRVREIKPVRGKRLLSGKSLTQKEMKHLLKTCQKDKTPAGKRDLAVLALMLASGLRRSEVCALELNEYDRKTGELNVNSGKGNRQRQLFIQQDARRLIRPWLDVRKKQAGRLFLPIHRSGSIGLRPLTPQGIYGIVKQRSRWAGVGCRPHDLRRTFVTQLLEAGVDLNTVRQLAGHSDIQTTVRYDLRNDRAKRDALKRLRLGVWSRVNIYPIIENLYSWPES